MRFADIPGLSDIKTNLVRSVHENKIPHAQLLAGRDGSVNLPLALAYTTFLHCQNRQADDACGTCAACSKSLKYIHPDSHFVFPYSNVDNDKDEERLKAELLKSWRQFLTEQPFGNIEDWTAFHGSEDKQVLISREESREIIRSLALKPFESRFKVMLIWQPEYMHPAAANGILKILEEPSSFTIFLLVSNADERLLPTIVSRTQRVTVPLLPDDEVKTFLAPRVDAGRLPGLVQLAEGNLNRGLQLIDREDNPTTEKFTQWMRACFKRDAIQLLTLADDFHAADKMDQRNMLTVALTMMRESLVHLSEAPLLRVQGNDLKFVQDFSKVLNVPKIEKATHLLNEAYFHLERNGSAKMIFMDLSLQLSGLLKASR